MHKQSCIAKWSLENDRLRDHRQDGNGEAGGQDMKPAELPPLEVPFERRIWTAKQVAEYLQVDYSTLLKTTRFYEGFPPPLPTFPGQYRWGAKAVTEWALADKSRQNHATDEISA